MDGDAEDELASVHTKGMVEEKQDSPAMLNRVMVKTFTKIDFGEEEDWLKKMAFKVKSYQLTGAGEEESNGVITDLQKEELWLDKMVHMLGLHQDHEMVKNKATRSSNDLSYTDTKNSQHDPGLADNGSEGNQILPDKWKREGEKRNSQHDLGPADDGLEEKGILSEEWKPDGSQHDPGPADDGWEGKRILLEE